MFPIIDGHVDLVHFMRQKAPGLNFSDLDSGTLSPEGFSQGKLSVFSSALFCPDPFNGPGTSGQMLQDLIRYSLENISGLQHLKDANDLKQFCIKEPEKTGYILLLENADVLADWAVRDLKDYGIFIIGLTHIGKNRLAEGNGVNFPSGLTEKGYRVVRVLDEEQMILDLAHLSEPGFWQVVDLYSGPLMTSHTGFRNFFDVPRNLSEKQLSEIVARDGLIGLTINPEMFGQPQIEITDVYHHIDWFVQRFGSRNLGIGTDFGGFEITGQQCSDYTCFQDLAEYLDKDGYAKNDIQSILADNWYRFLVRNLPGG